MSIQWKIHRCVTGVSDFVEITADCVEVEERGILVLRRNLVVVAMFPSGVWMGIERQTPV